MAKNNFNRANYIDYLKFDNNKLYLYTQDYEYGNNYLVGTNDNGASSSNNNTATWVPNVAEEEIFKFEDFGSTYLDNEDILGFPTTDFEQNTFMEMEENYYIRIVLSSFK